MLTRQTILKTVVLFFALLWVVDADAAIYKWKDENGKTHFTDDPTNVPEAYRQKPFLKGIQRQKEAPNSKKGKVQSEGDTSGEIEGVESEKKEGDKQEGLTDAQRSTVEAVVNFLKEDISRYNKYYTYPPSRSKFRMIKLAVAGATPQKQSLLGQVSQHNLPLFQSIAGFLKTSIAKDEKSQKIMPTTITSKPQTRRLMNRLKSEAGQEKQLLEKLNTALNAKK
jgi:hypothetical protein